MALVPCHTTSGYLDGNLGCRKHSLAHGACSSIRKMGICLVGLGSKTATVLLEVGLEEGCQNLLQKVWELTREGPCQVGGSNPHSTPLASAHTRKLPSDGVHTIPPACDHRATQSPLFISFPCDVGSLLL